MKSSFYFRRNYDAFALLLGVKLFVLLEVVSWVFIFWGTEGYHAQRIKFLYIAIVVAFALLVFISFTLYQHSIYLALNKSGVEKNMVMDSYSFAAKDQMHMILQSDAGPIMLKVHVTKVNRPYYLSKKKGDSIRVLIDERTRKGVVLDPPR